jgi:hypothetical protein
MAILQAGIFASLPYSAQNRTNTGKLVFPYSATLARTKISWLASKLVKKSQLGSVYLYTSLHPTIQNLTVPDGGSANKVILARSAESRSYRMKNVPGMEFATIVMAREDEKPRANRNLK